MSRLERVLLAPEFLAPAPLVSVAVLALNDHLLKSRLHNALTGKLSDFAGCFALPLFTSALLAGWLKPRARAWVGVGATTLLFATVKLSQPASDALMPALAWVGQGLGLGGRMHVVADPSDLVALMMVPVAFGFARRAAGTTWESGEPEAAIGQAQRGPRRRRSRAGRVRLARLLAVLAHARHRLHRPRPTRPRAVT